MSEITPQGRKALVTVAEWLEAGAPHKMLGNGLQVDRFDMEKVVEVNASCGTSCCIAGAVCQFEGLGMGNRYRDGGLEWSGMEGGWQLAKDFVGLETREANQLFMPWNYFSGDSESYNSAAQGAAVIRHLLATGVVDWDRFDVFGKVVEDFEEMEDE